MTHTQTPADDPYDEGVDAASLALLDVARALMGITLRAVAASPVPLTVPQHRVLVMVRTDGPRRIGTLAGDLGVNQSNASRLVDRIIAQGLARRCPDPEDGRASLVELTDLGSRVLDVVHAHRLHAVRDVVARMPSRARPFVTQGLHELAAATQRDPRAD